MAPHTGRSARLISKLYGYRSPKEFVAELPENARVADIGAGNSNLGRVAAGLRPDIQWTNIDIQYDDFYPSLRERSKAPDNVSYVAADILHSCLQAGSLDLIVSNAALPFIIMTDEVLAMRALYSMRESLKTDGRMILGKGIVNGALFRKKDGAVHATAQEFDEDPEKVLRELTVRK